MKKRLKGLLALTLTLCMVLGMATAISSADSKTVNVGLISEKTVVNAGDILYYEGSGGQLSVYYDDELVTKKTTNSDAELQISDWYIQDASDDTKYNKVEGGVKFFITDPYGSPIKGHTVLNNDKDGYVKDQWNITAAPDNNKYWYEDTTYHNYVEIYNTLYLAKLESIPINYTIKYTDGAGKTADGVTFTVENKNGTIVGADELRFKKDGYTLEKWLLENGTTIAVGENIKDIYSKLINNAEPSESGEADEMVITLEAKWSENSGAAPGIEQGKGDTNKADNNPATGDDANIVLWLAIMTLAMISGVGVVLASRRKRV